MFAVCLELPFCHNIVNYPEWYTCHASLIDANYLLGDEMQWFYLISYSYFPIWKNGHYLVWLYASFVCCICFCLCKHDLALVFFSFYFYPFRCFTCRLLDLLSLLMMTGALLKKYLILKGDMSKKPTRISSMLLRRVDVSAFHGLISHLSLYNLCF